MLEQLLSAITPNFEGRNWREFIVLNRWLFFWIAFVMMLALLVGAQQDYIAYQIQWQQVLDGKNPWLAAEDWQQNAYGPVFNSLALLFKVHHMLPRLFFIAVWAFGSFKLFQDLPRERVSQAVLFLLFNVFFLVELIGFGHFDVLIAVAIFLGVRAYRKQKDVLAGVLFATAIGLKFYPIVVLPFLALDQGGRIRARFIASTVFFTVFIFAVAWMIWGNAIWTPLFFAAGREARQLSIFNFINGEDSALKRLGVFVPQYTWKIVLVLAGGFTFLCHLRKRMEPEQACLAALLITFLIYPAGHAQFQTVLFFLALSVRTGLDPVWRRYLIALSVYTLLFGVTEGYQRWGMAWIFNFICIGMFTMGIRAWRRTLGESFGF